MYKVYVKADETGRVVAINSSEFLDDLTGWVEIDQGHGDRFHHAQANYLPGPLRDAHGVCCYKLEDGEVLERTAEEMAADRGTFTDKPTIESRVENVEEKTGELEEALSLILSGVTE